MSKKCPYCREYIQDDAVKCRFCGEFLGSSLDTPPAEVPESTQFVPTPAPAWQQQYEKKSDPAVHPVTGEPMRPRPNNNLPWAILATVFCCQPLGIVSIVYAAKVDNAYNSGFIEESYKSAKRAETWAIASLVSGIIVVIFYLVVVFAAEFFPF